MFKVIDPCADRNLLTPAQLRAAAGVATDSTDLTDLGLQISDSIARDCNVRSDGSHVPTLLSEGCRQVFRPGRGTPALILGRSSVTSVTSVKVDGVELDVDTDVEFEACGLLYLLRSDRRVQWCGSKVEVEFTAGLVAVPSDLVMIASDYVKLQWSSRDRDPLKKVEVVEGMGRDEWFEDSAATVEKLKIRLAPYVQYGY